MASSDQGHSVSEASRDFALESSVSKRFSESDSDAKSDHTPLYSRASSGADFTPLSTPGHSRVPTGVEFSPLTSAEDSEIQSDFDLDSSPSHSRDSSTLSDQLQCSRLSPGVRRLHSPLSSVAELSAVDSITHSQQSSIGGIPSVDHSRVPSAVDSITHSQQSSISGIPSVDHSRVPSAVDSIAHSQQNSIGGIPSVDHSRVPSAVDSIAHSQQSSIGGIPSVDHSRVPSAVDSITHSQQSSIGGIPSVDHSRVPSAVDSITHSQQSSIGGIPSVDHSRVPSAVDSITHSQQSSIGGIPSVDHSRVPSSSATVTLHSRGPSEQSRAFEPFYVQELPSPITEIAILKPARATSVEVLQSPVQPLPSPFEPHNKLQVLPEEEVDQPSEVELPNIELAKAKDSLEQQEALQDSDMKFASSLVPFPDRQVKDLAAKSEQETPYSSALSSASSAVKMDSNTIHAPLSMKHVKMKAVQGSPKKLREFSHRDTPPKFAEFKPPAYQDINISSVRKGAGVRDSKIASARNSVPSTPIGIVEVPVREAGVGPVNPDKILQPDPKARAGTVKKKKLLAQNSSSGLAPPKYEIAVDMDDDDDIDQIELTEMKHVPGDPNFDPAALASRKNSSIAPHDHLNLPHDRGNSRQKLLSSRTPSVSDDSRPGSGKFYPNRADSHMDDLHTIPLFTVSIANAEQLMEAEAELKPVLRDVDGQIVKQKNPYTMYIILSMCLMYFLVEIMMNNFTIAPLKENPLLGPDYKVLEKLGAKRADLVVKDNGFWRLIMCTFLHGGLVHLAMNMSVLWRIGKQLEVQYGWLKFTIIYTSSAISGGLMSCLFLPTVLGVGASGALYGLIGALFGDFIQNYYKIENKCSYLSSMIVSSVVGLALGLMPMLDNFAHLGGFICGVLCGTALLAENRVSRRSNRCMGDFCTVMCTILLFVWFVTAFVLLYAQIDAHATCPWCKYLSCVETPFWQCYTVPQCKFFYNNTEQILPCCEFEGAPGPPLCVSQ